MGDGGSDAEVYQEGLEDWVQNPESFRDSTISELDHIKNDWNTLTTAGQSYPTVEYLYDWMLASANPLSLASSAEREAKNAVKYHQNLVSFHNEEGVRKSIEESDRVMRIIEPAVDILKNSQHLQAVRLEIPRENEVVTFELSPNEVQTLQSHPERACAAYLDLTQLRDSRIQTLLLGTPDTYYRSKSIHAINYILANGYPPQTIRHLAEIVERDRERTADPMQVVQNYAQEKGFTPINPVSPEAPIKSPPDPKTGHP